MKEIIFVIGGCRSGKSVYALKLAQQVRSERKLFVATCVPYDDEMKQRVANHQNERDQTWTTLEVPVDIPQTLLQNSRKEDVVLIDCLTLWISNILMENLDLNNLYDHINRLIGSLNLVPCTVVLVSNEVGTGIVPENKLSRLFRDATGYANQQVAALADKVIWMVAGIPVPIKASKP